MTFEPAFFTVELSKCIYVVVFIISYIMIAVKNFKDTNMNHFLSIVVLGAALVLGGCGSTDKSPDVAEKNKVDLPRFLDTNPKPLVVYSTTEYKWKDYDSFALNIANMASKSTVGTGLSDSSRPYSVQVETNSDLLNGLSGFLTGGFIGAAGSISMGNSHEDILSWHHGIVEFFDEGIIDDPSAIAVIRQRIGEKVHAALVQKFPDTQYHGDFDHLSRTDTAFNNIFLFSGDVCEQSLLYQKPEGMEIKASDYYKKATGVTDINAEDSSVCFLLLKIGVTGVFDGKAIVVAEAFKNVFNFFFIDTMASHYDGLVLMTNKAELTNRYVKGKTILTYNYAKVFYKSELKLFDSNDKSEPLQL